MFTAKLKIAAVSLLAVLIAIGGGGLLGFQSLSAGLDAGKAHPRHALRLHEDVPT